MSKSVRDGIRSEIFKNREGKKKLINIFGQDIEVRQPRLKDILSIQKKYDQGLDVAFVSTLIEYCYVPGTDDKVFEDTDRELILSLPTGEWVETFNQALEELTSIKVEEAEKN